MYLVQQAFVEKTARGQEMAGCDEAKSLASMEEEACVEKKYGGIAPKKPLISKDHERAYFDSADWVLGKQAANSNGSKAAVETLKPKLKNASSPAPSSQANMRIKLSREAYQNAAAARDLEATMGQVDSDQCFCLS
uniref:Negatively light-regulated protein n=1 Tax=Oryza punctata TaxID=4537 RepID=A0A0E0KCQ3_ORYPU